MVDCLLYGPLIWTYTTQYYGWLLVVWPTCMNISMLMMAIMTIYAVWGICWYALVWNVHNNTQERCERCSVGYFSLPVLLLLALLAQLWGPWQQRRNGLKEWFQVQWNDNSRMCQKADNNTTQQWSCLRCQYCSVDDVQTVKCTGNVPTVCSTGLWRGCNSTIKSIIGFAYLAVVRWPGTGTYFMHRRKYNLGGDTLIKPPF